VICNEEDTDGRTRVTTDEQRVRHVGLDGITGNNWKADGSCLTGEHYKIYYTHHKVPAIQHCAKQPALLTNHLELDGIEQCFMSPPTQYTLYGRRFLQVKRPNQQYQSTEGTYNKHADNRKTQ